jgi:HlyD family type I secretion membrane fusion protein
MSVMFWKSPPATGSVELEDDKFDSSHKELKVGVAVASAFFIGLLGWAALTPLDAGAMAQGVVAVSGNRQAVQHREGGTVTRLEVLEGQAVRQGDILLTISASEMVAIERGLAGEVISLMAERARLTAERDVADTVTEPVEFAGLPEQDRALAADALRGQRLLFDARRRSMQTEREVLAQQSRQHGEQINGHSHQMRSNREQQRLITEELASLQQLVGRGFVSVNRIRAMERNAAELVGNYGALQAEVARASSAVAETRLQSVSIDRRMMEEVATRARDVQVRLDELQPRLIATREQLALSTVRAPASGRVVGLKVFTVGGVVAPGEVLMEIVPQDRALVVEARASPNDADDLRVGMETQVRFSALQQRNLPILMGTISKVSADSMEDPRSGLRYFQIEVIVPPTEIARIRKVRADSGLRAGLPAEVMVPLRKRNALSYLIEPLTQTLWASGREN